jgi:UDP-N-acetylglucosamine 4,6-dehydratase
MSFWADQTVLVTGGTGSFGRAFVAYMLAQPVRKVIVFSRDELKQHEMQRGGFDDPRIRWFLGDVRDRDRLYRAFQGVDIVVHAAAMKQVPACEYNPFEAIRTNVIGAQNLIDAAIDRGVRRVIALSTDKACNPANLYGATKLCSDKLFLHGNRYAGGADTRFACVRYGNVVGSRGSVVPLFVEQASQGVLTLTHPDMTRFWITLDQGVAFVARCTETMTGGELFVPRLPTTRIDDLARAIAPDARFEVIGIRDGEKMHEVMISEDDARLTLDCGDHFILCSDASTKARHAARGTPVAEGFRYSSDAAGPHLAQDAIRSLLADWLGQGGIPARRA